MTTNESLNSANHEKRVSAASGWALLFINLLMYAGVVTLVIGAFAAKVPLFGLLAVILLIGAILTSCGFMPLQPNESAVLILFGTYKGTVRDSGFFWVNPFMSKKKVSLRSRNLNGDKLKVNDKRGNPIEIAAVVVWRVRDTAQAIFDVDAYEHYVAVQSESAVRHLASGYAYDDSGDAEEMTLRASGDAVSEALTIELQERLGKAGIEVQESRLSHLAYAPEIAQAMLRRQQAEAVIAARTKIVQGAVGMVEMALTELESKGVVELDAERKASMVSNLLVVLCGESEVHPVVNTGTLYS
ncbi:SPFH domain-containing protein [Synoicihabitans lomoniglobus]|uniref:SPFH domain-containing protein n=1 Tax=Synoicihabitans lomoniglobus TaxID=2909285 RepID=A0AAF0CQK6_9BACT|nr:SPFH domain-containing protein [Opitutaceae bacterium LMO-M01]WED66245.1 SPFH domain-containing protein [Opitutaceae bacterium LMO-M01]